MPREIDDLKARAVIDWPTVLAHREKATSIIPKLIESQEKFIGILYVADASPTAWKDVLAATNGMPPNLFLKHLIVLADVGGERLQSYRTAILKFFPTGTMTFRWKDAEHTYAFRSLNTLRIWTKLCSHVGWAYSPTDRSTSILDYVRASRPGGTFFLILAADALC
jgi:hypothetical protein